MYLRWLIALTLILLLISGPPHGVRPYVVRLAVVAALVLINLLFSLAGERRVHRWSMHPLFFLADFGLMTTGILLVPGIAEGIHLLYFLAILVGASISRLSTALLVMAVVGCGYFAYNVGIRGSDVFLTPRYLLCAPFLLIVVCLINYLEPVEEAGPRP